MSKSTPSENAKLPACNLTLLIGDIHITFNPPLIHIGCSKPSPETAAWLGPPSLCGGLRAEHVTIPLVPLSHGPHAGKLNVHLTYKAGSRSIHKTIAFIEPDVITAKVASFTEQLLAYHLHHTRRVSRDELQREGYVVTLLGKDYKQKLEGVFHRRRSTYRLNQGALATLQDHLELYDLEILDQLCEENPLAPVILVRESDGAVLAVGYFPHGLGPEHPPGWYAMPRPQDWLDVLPALLGPWFYETLAVISTELQCPVNRDGLRSAYAKSQGQPSSPSLTERDD